MQDKIDLLLHHQEQNKGHAEAINSLIDQKVLMLKNDSWEINPLIK